MSLFKSIYDGKTVCLSVCFIPQQNSQARHYVYYAGTKCTQCSQGIKCEVKCFACLVIDVWVKTIKESFSSKFC